LGIASVVTIINQERLDIIGGDGLPIGALSSLFKIRLSDKKVKEQLITYLECPIENIRIY
jgi:hypothetical protein